jgi:hypothetical protein
MQRALQSDPGQSTLLEDGNRTQKRAQVVIIEFKWLNHLPYVNYWIVLGQTRGLLYADSLLTRVGSHVYPISRTP